MKKLQLKMDMVRSIGKQSGEYVESVLKKKKMKATLWEGFAAEKEGFNLLAVVDNESAGRDSSASASFRRMK